MAVLLLGSLATPLRAHAWDYDTHYLWTYYLALHAGFTDRQAYQIASGTEAIDIDHDTDPIFGATPEAKGGGGNHFGPLVRVIDANTPLLERFTALREAFDFSKDNLTALLGPESPYGNPAMGRVWRKYHCFAERALQDNFKRAERGEPGALAWLDLLGVATDINADILTAREEQRKALWAQALKDGNPGPYLHYSQDCPCHGEFTDLRGHAVWGHAPDWWSVDERAAWDMTLGTLTALKEFRRDYLGEPIEPSDLTRIRAVFERLLDANPSTKLGIPEGGDDRLWSAHSTPEGSFYNFVSPVAATLSGQNAIDFACPDMKAARLILEEAIKEDRAAGRFRPFPKVEWKSPPEGFLHYDFDPNAQVHMDPEEYLGGTTYRAARSRSRAATGFVDAYRVEQPKMKVLADSSEYPRVVRISPDRTSTGLYFVDVALTYEVSGVGAFLSGLPVYEYCDWKHTPDISGTESTAFRGNGTWQVRSRAPVSYQVLRGGVEWVCTLDAHGLEPQEITVVARWTGPPPEEEEDREPGASMEFGPLWGALLDVRDRAIGHKVQVESACMAVERTREAVAAEIKEYDRSLGPVEREVKALEEVAAVLPTARERADEYAQRAWESAEQAAEARDRVGEEALECCQIAERIRVTEDIPELTRLMEQAQEAHEAAEGWRDTALDAIAASEGAAKRASTLKEEVSGFQTELSHVRDYLDRALPALAKARGRVESSPPVLDRARSLVPVFASLEGEATGILGEAEALLEAAPSKENKQVLRRLRGLHREVAAMSREGGRCLDQEHARLETLGPEVVALERSTSALQPRVEHLSSISLDPDTMAFITLSASEAEASFAAADLFADSVGQMVDDSSTCLGVSKDEVKEKTDPEAQVADYDCSMFFNARAGWDRRNRQPSCFCINDRYTWNAEGTGCEPIPEPEGPEPDDPYGPRCEYQAFLIRQFRANPEPLYQQMAQQTADQAVAMGCAPALITEANGGAAGGQETTTSGAASTTSGAAGSPFRRCEWAQEGTGNWGSGEGTGEYYCTCALHDADGNWSGEVELGADWECGPRP